jgi:hypothetical protein
LVAEVTFGVCLRERCEKRRCGDEQRRVSRLDGSVTERDRQARLADAGRFEEPRVLCLHDDLRRCCIAKRNDQAAASTASFIACVSCSPSHF